MDLQALVLANLDIDGLIADTAQLKIDEAEINQLEVLSCLDSLKSKEILVYSALNIERYILTSEGLDILKLGSHEVRVFDAVPETGISIPQMTQIVGVSAKFGQAQAFKSKWISKNSEGMLVRLVNQVKDQTQLDLTSIIKEGLRIADQQKLVAADILLNYKKRKLIEVHKTTSYSVKKGVHFTTTLVQQETDMTAALLAGDWKKGNFKKYNFEAAGSLPTCGHLHPLLKVRDQFRQIFLELGFSEMPANKYVESSFWNFDALFQPQMHPARDAHDTFFLSAPAISSKLPEEYLERVKKVHSTGGYGSIGHQYNWKRSEAEKLILRTHTTAISSNMLYKLAQEPVFKPVKWFSIDRVFRNETLDQTHLAEFHQIEGVVADVGLTLGDLIGVLHGFFKKLGIENLRFKPAYNPYTEPSMEIFAWHPGLKKYVELGNSGIFRPEMLLPLGLPPDVRVIAWGLSTERPTMIKYGINNIRELVGHKLDLEMVARNPICRLDKQ